jgi:hypothetical protein
MGVVGKVDLKVVKQYKQGVMGIPKDGQKNMVIIG